MKKLKAIIPPNYVNTDYIQFKTKNGQIANSSIGQFHGGKNWVDQNKATLKKGLIMQDSAEAISMYLAVVDAHINGTKLHHPAKNNPLKKGDIVKESVVRDICNEFIQSNWQNLNNYFQENNDGILMMKKAIGLDKNNNLIYSNPEEVKYLNKNGVLVNLKDFNEKGLVTERSKDNNLDRSKNLYYYKPENKSVARLDDCGDGPNWNGTYFSVNYFNADLRVRESLRIWQAK